MEVFIVQHVHSLDDGGEDVKLIGVYSSESAARQAIARLTPLPGFSDNAAGFHVDRYVVDQDQWTEGFVTTTADRSPAEK